MALAKGTNLAPARAQLARDAFAASRATFSEWAGLDAPAVPPNDVDAAQVLLHRWQVSLFSLVPTTDAILALGIVEELAETFDADEDAEEAVDGLGDICVYAAQICTLNRMAFRNVLELAELYCVSAHDRAGISPIVAAGQLAHVVGKHEQKTRGLAPIVTYGPALADAIALVIAKAIEDVAMVHNLRIRAAGVFVTIATEVMQRKAGDVMIPGSVSYQPPVEADRPPDLHHSQGHVVSEVLAAAAADRKATALESLGRGMDVLERLDKEGDGFDISDVVAAAGICPQCADLMSHDGSKLTYTCGQGHEFTDAQIKALLPHLLTQPE